ncbi:GAF and ANTAR domain-containing protein [Nakamurella flavida]|uniref:GAF and ANTAR domain-containing protein n=1 Tax=Nakamurella flavida TaxID=363630 RepID=A0A938YGN5_9ACTN|nr:ANTAR domain-containing protein [Nakamurella flavida]MBM9477350.1 GAF and ANTAR domain-containing protein [Nakamurella flavida]MDP9777282.1 hypothetical protein [Nakamurella flavida]
MIAAGEPSGAGTVLARAFGVVAGSLDAGAGTTSTLHTVLRLAVEMVPGASCAQVVLAADGRTVHAPHGRSLPAQGLPGPVPDGGSCPSGTGRCRLDLALTSGGREVGSLTLWCRHPPSGHEHDRRVGEILAAHAAVALRHALRYEELAAALDRADVIGRAKGILMARHGLDSQQAFDALRTRSTAHGHDLQVCAAEVVGRE